MKTELESDLPPLNISFLASKQTEMWQKRHIGLNILQVYFLKKESERYAWLCLTFIFCFF